LHLQNEAHNTHCIKQNEQFLLNKTALFQYKKIRNDKCSHLIFKLSFTSSHTCSKYLSPLSSCCINYATAITSCNLVGFC